MSNTNYVAPSIARYGFHTHDKHNTLSVVYVCEDGKNLITDSAFESGNGNWKQDSLFASGIASWVEDKNAKSGNHTLKLEANNPKEQKVWATSYFEVEPNTTYYFTAVVKGEQWSDTNKCDMTLGLVNPETEKFIITNNRPWTCESQYGFSFDGNWHFIRGGFNSGSLNKIGIGFCGSSFLAFVDKLYLFKESDKVNYTFFDGRDAIGGKLVSLVPEKTVCDEEDNMFQNHDLEKSDYSFWESGVSFGMTVTLGQHDEEHGLSLHYLENTYSTNIPKQTYYLKWVNVERNTKYTFSAEYCTTKAGAGWFGVMAGNKYLPKPITKHHFDTYNDDWCRVGVTFNTGSYDRVALAVCDCGGEGYIDNLYLFKAE